MKQIKCTKHIRRALSLVFIAFILTTMLAGCGGSKLSADFDKQKIEETSKEVIVYLNNKDSEAILEMSTVSLKNALTPDVLQQIFEAVDEAGEYVKVIQISTAGHKDRSTEEEFAIAVIKTKYQYKKVIYTLTFTKQMKLAGLFYR